MDFEYDFGNFHHGIFLYYFRNYPISFECDHFPIRNSGDFDDDFEEKINFALRLKNVFTIKKYNNRLQNSFNKRR